MKQPIKKLYFSKQANQYLTIVLFMIFFTPLFANNISISNTTLISPNTSEHYISIQFSLQWENSWRTESAPHNWDAAWVFAKYRVTGEDEWHHVLLCDSGYSVPSDAAITTGLLQPSLAFNAETNQGMGVFLYRNEAGTGTFTLENVKLRWLYGKNGLDETSLVEIRVFAIEMVYVPQGSFYVGNTGTETGRLHRADNASAAFEITSENAIITQSSGSGNLWGTEGITGWAAVSPSNPHTIPANFPKGYKAFYCMKYAISQGQYAAFLNTLTRAQQNERTATSLSSGTTSVTNRYVMTNSSTVSERNGIRCDASINGTAPIEFYCDLNGNDTRNEENDGGCIPCNFISWADLVAYLHWSALRPMTELEYEKACRGTLSAVAGEYAWGTATIASNNYTISDSGDISESIASNYSTTVGNAHYTNTQLSAGPVRNGIFAAHTSNSGRITAGASYYGILELSGNTWERPITIANAEGRTFTGLHGSGDLNASGNATTSFWPSIDAVGSGFRGGSWRNNSDQLQVSHRHSAGKADTSRAQAVSGRGVRTVP
jgi:formylglycine-generating enzyme required for sulfatase activity